MIGRCKPLTAHCRNTFGIISAWHQEKQLGVNELSHHQLKTNLHNLGCGFIELRCNFLPNSTQPIEEKSLFIPEVNLYDLMMLGNKYKQHAVLYKNKVQFDLLGVPVGKCFAAFDSGSEDVLETAYQKYLETRYPRYDGIEIVSLKFIDSDI